MVSFEVQYFREVKSNLSSVSPIIQKYKVNRGIDMAFIFSVT